MVELFVQEGANVVAVARGEERLNALVEELKDAPGKIEIFVGDVSQKKVNEQMIDFAIEKFGKLDVLVNNAGIMDNMAAVGDALDEKFDQLMAVNVYGPMCAMRKAVNVFLSQGNGGCIINMGSEGAQKNSAGAVYCASKAALEALSKNTAFMYADQGNSHQCGGHWRPGHGNLRLHRPTQHELYAPNQKHAGNHARCWSTCRCGICSAVSCQR